MEGEKIKGLGVLFDLRWAGEVWRGSSGCINGLLTNDV